MVAKKAAEGIAEMWRQLKRAPKVRARRDQNQARGCADLAMALATLPFAARPKLDRSVDFCSHSAACAVAMDMRRRIIRFQ